MNQALCDVSKMAAEVLDLNSALYISDGKNKLKQRVYMIAFKRFSEDNEQNWIEIVISDLYRNYTDSGALDNWDRKTNKY